MTAFRPMRAQEEGAVIALWQVCGLTRPWNDPSADIALARARENSDILVAEQAGILTVTVMIGHDGHRAWVYYLAVDPDHRRKGLARVAMDAAEEWARARGVPKMHLMVRPENRAVMSFYDALGYEVGATTLMQKWLDPARDALFRENRP